ncbi:MAG: metallophosphoesterase [Pseudomonadota bacterium]
MNDDHAVDKPLFSFAVITDSHVNQAEDECNSPFDVNRRANQRLRYVVAELNKHDLVAVFHLGDVVHPVPSMGTLYSDAAGCFFDQAQHLRHPLHLIPGNHDVGDKPISWGPAGTVRDDFLNAWTEQFGAHYFYVEYQGIHFLGINAQLVGSGLAMEAEQCDWLEERLNVLNGQRIFLFTHYPPYLESRDEEEHYDNMGHAGRDWLLGLLEQYRIEGLFAGHVHHFWYNKHAQCDCYLLPATSFARQDYSEMFRVSPAPELGRNDAPKLGFFLIHVYADRHDFEMVRSFGAQRVESLQVAAPEASARLKSVNPRTNRCARIGFDLRADWMERVQIPPSGGLDELDRKWVRNDYGLLALWEMGVRQLRVPFQDLDVASRRERLEVLYGLGFRYSTYLHSSASEKQIAVVTRCVDLIEAVDLLVPPGTADSATRELVLRLHGGGVRVNLSPMRSKHDIIKSGKKYYHVINHGVTLNDLSDDDIDVALLDESLDVDGYCLRAGAEDDLFALFTAGARLDKTRNTKSTVHLRMTADNPSESIEQDDFAEQRLSQALFLSWATQGPGVICDALADNDRGYFPRRGVLDRLYNPGKGFFAVRHLHTILSEIGESTQPVALRAQAGGYVCTLNDTNVHLRFAESYAAPRNIDRGWDLIGGGPVDVKDSGSLPNLCLFTAKADL